MSIWHIIGILAVLALIVGVGVLSGRRVKSAADFATGGGKAGSLLVCGTIMGSLVSSQATVGTAQLAFHYGLSAWWFTLGAGVGCVLLALGYTNAMRRSRCVTELQMVSQEYGAGAESLGSVLCSIGIFISVLAQVIACAGLVTVVFPSVPTAAAILLSVSLMALYVLFGGAWGAGMGGVVKLILLYAASISGLILVLVLSGNLSGLTDNLKNVLLTSSVGAVQSAEALPDITSAGDISSRFFSLVARGPLKDIGSGLSLALGVISTQTYAQAVLSGKSDRAARRGALLGACLTPPLGAAGIFIGLYMRGHFITQAEADAFTAAGKAVPDLPVLASTIQVFPAFVLHCMPALFAGVVLGTLLITIVSGGAGLSLGVATILVNDVFRRISKKFEDPQVNLAASRGAILAVLALSGALAMMTSGAMINDFGFLSMGLRGSVVFLPVTCALFLPGRINRRCMVASMIAGPAAVLYGHFAGFAFDPLFLGMAAALLCVALGALVHAVPRLSHARA